MWQISFRRAVRRAPEAAQPEALPISAETSDEEAGVDLPLESDPKLSVLGLTDPETGGSQELLYEGDRFLCALPFGFEGGDAGFEDVEGTADDEADEDTDPEVKRVQFEQFLERLGSTAYTKFCEVGFREDRKERTPWPNLQEGTKYRWRAVAARILQEITGENLEEEAPE